MSFHQLPYNQNISWFFNSFAYKSDCEIELILPTRTVHALENRIIDIESTGRSKKYVIFVADEIIVKQEWINSLRSQVLQAKDRGVSAKHFLIIANIESPEHQHLPRLLNLPPENMLCINYFELRTYFFHAVLGDKHNSCFNKAASHPARYFVGKAHKLHRIFLMYLLDQHKLLDTNTTSLLIDPDDIDFISQQCAQKYQENIGKQSLEKVKKVIEQYQGSPDGANPLRISPGVCHYPGHPYNPDTYQNSRFSVIPEAVFDELEVPFVTEKTYNAIYNHHPFVLLSSCGSLNTLCKYGYKTFHSVIDELYDQIKDHSDRIVAVCNSSTQMSVITKDSAVAEHIAEITKHNFQTLITNACRTIDTINRAVEL